MDYVDFGNTGLKVSRFGLGCMRLPQMMDANGETHTDEAAAIEMIRYAIDNGVNYIDTAYVYKESEVVVGKALRDGYREKVILATKQPTSILKDDPTEQEKYFQEQLERLQTDYFDVYFLHNLGPKNWETVKKLDGLGFIKGLKEQGKIKFAAASVHSDFKHFKEVADAFDWDLMMLQYNYYDKFNQAGQPGARYVVSKGIPLAIMESNRGGMLAAGVPQNVRDAFKSCHGLPDYEYSQRWLIAQNEPTVILNGCSSLEQLKQNLAVYDKYSRTDGITAESEAEFDEARAQWNALVKVKCTACNYCMPCPRGVNIPSIFNLYNMTARTEEKFAQTWAYFPLHVDTKTDASQCVDCKICVSKCPQGIAIPTVLREAHAALTK